MAAAAAAAAVVREAAASAVMDALEGESEEEKSSKMAAAKEDKMRKVIRWDTNTSGFAASAGQTISAHHKKRQSCSHILECRNSLLLITDWSNISS